LFCTSYGLAFGFYLIPFRTTGFLLSTRFPFTIGGTKRKAVDFVLHAELGGVTGMIAPIVGKQPPDYHIWILPDTSYGPDIEIG
jgi:hypothetical protein